MLGGSFLDFLGASGFKPSSYEHLAAHYMLFWFERMLLVQGLADTFILLGMPFDSTEAKQLNKEIFETIYFSALETSCRMSKKEGIADALIKSACARTGEDS